jgi:predicted Zn-dependent protease
MFAKLQQSAGLNDSGAYPYLRSHPLTTERMADMQARLQLSGPTTRSSGDMVQAMLAARAKVMSQNSVEALKSWAQDRNVKSPQATPSQKAGALYAAALAHLQLRETTAAESALQDLLSLTAPIPQAKRLATLLQAEMAIRQERFAWALQVLETSSVKPLQRPELMATAQALLRLPPHPARTRITQELRDHVTQAPNDAQAWNTLASMLALQGQALPSLRAEGEAQMARMDWPGATDRFRAAQDWARNNRLQAGDHIEASIVDTRLRQAQSNIKAMQTER